MQIFFIKKEDKVGFFRKFFKKIRIDEDMILINYDSNNVNFNYKIKMVKAIKKFLIKRNVEKLIVSKELKKDDEFLNLLYGSGFDIIDGRILFKQLIYDILENICSKNNIKREEKKMSIAVNQVNKFALELVESLSKQFKTLNVVTNNVSLFKNIKDKLWEEDGIIIIITNNRKKALVNSDIILNVDFPEELINKYAIFDDCILINMEESVKIKKKRFNGKIINDYDVKFKENSYISSDLGKEKYKDFYMRDLAEVYLINSPKEIDNLIIDTVK